LNAIITKEIAARRVLKREIECVCVSRFYAQQQQQLLKAVQNCIDFSPQIGQRLMKI